MFNALTQYLHPDPIDVINLHVGNSGNLDLDPNTKDPYTNQFGFRGAWNADIMSAYKRTADLSGKPFFSADFIDCDGTPGCDVTPMDPRHNFTRAMLRKVADLHIPLSTQWIWEWRQPNGAASSGVNLVTPFDAPTAEYMSMYSAVASAATATTQSLDMTPPNMGFDYDANSDGIPDQWAKTGTGVVARTQDTFSTWAIDFSNTGSSTVTLTSTVMPVGMTVPSGARILATVASKTSAVPGFVGSASMHVLGKANADGSGATTADLTIQVANDTSGNFKVYWGTASLPTSTRSIVVTLNGTSVTQGHVEFDDVRVSLLY